MQYAWIGKGYMVYLEKGEKKIPSLIRFCAVNVICNAQLTKLGVLKSKKSVNMALKKEYIRQEDNNGFRLLNRM